ncbi:MAG TPA: PLP-dependent aminotransferase family protein [Sediminispirochaeta sp.]|nr:PLP-dependent aminotransferase family protein [Sediminispirochaeta sp.]
MLDESLLSTRTSRMGSSAIREILKVLARPGIVSLAGGMPAPEAFPMDHVEGLFGKVISKYGSDALQYGTTEGFTPLKAALAKYLNGRGIQTKAEQINITTGSQGVLDALGKIFVSPGDAIAVEAPTYLGALQAFNPYEPEYVEMETDEQGLIPESMEEVVRKHHPKLVYLVPTFQNPTGRTIPLERRRQIAEIAARHNVLVVEDDPYGQLRYRGDHVAPIQSFAPEQVIYCGSFSKVFAPGLRVGYYVAPDFVREWLIRAKQGVDLHTSSLSQALAAEFLAEGLMEQHLPKIIKLYKPKQEAMLQALRDFFPDSFRWTEPEGGMFIWAEGPKGLDTVELYHRAVEKKVAFVPGRYFYTREGAGAETMRLNFTMADEETLRAAVQRLSEAIKET